MCGIAGIYSLTGKPLLDPERRILKMLSLQLHRGPDQSGYKLSKDKKLVLGNARLSIVDPNTVVKTPFYKEVNGNILSFNGEIYNYKNLRKELSALGCSFETETDTEVLFEAIEFHKGDVFNKLDGMWGFAHYDSKSQTLLISRDLMGERHIFYAIQDGELIFSSEVQSILAVINSYEFDFSSSLGAWMYNVSPPEKTLVEKVKRLLPGHNIIVKGGEIKYEIHSKLQPEKWGDFFNTRSSVSEVQEQFVDLLSRSVNLRIPSDVPYVSTQSGGIDSTLINIMASNYGSNKTRAYFGHSTNEQITKNNDTLNEFDAANLISKKLDIDLHSFYMNTADSVPILGRIAENCFDGCIDDGVAPFEFLAAKAKSEGYKVMMISDGPDDFAGGYSIDKKSNFLDGLYKEKKGIYELVRILSPLIGPQIVTKFFGPNYVFDAGHSYNPFKSKVTHQLHSKEFMKNIYIDNLVDGMYDSYGSLPSYYSLSQSNNYSSDRALSYAAKSTPDMFNLRVDKAFMKHSVEVRLPFQDPALVEFLVALPSFYRFKDGNDSKYLLRGIVEKYIGSEISNRGKYGFSSHLWETPSVYSALKFEEVIQDSALFKEKVFKKSALNFILNKKNHPGLRWSAYALASTYQKIQDKAF
jgi:asparagine synthase (glutamine-hydrolysing)